MSDQRAVAFIFARGGSKGIPRKNLKILGGKPLIAHSIETALSSHRISNVIVSTDDLEIAETARAYGAETPFMRPAELATDQAPEWLAWRHAVDWLETHGRPFDIFVSLPATSPFRATADIDAAIDRLSPDFDLIVSVTDAKRHPQFNMVRIAENGLVQQFSMAESHITRRQEAPLAFDMTTVVYVCRPEFVKVSNGVFDGRVGAVHIPEERALDIDTPYDFEVAEALDLLRNKKGI